MSSQENIRYSRLAALFAACLLFPFTATAVEPIEKPTNAKCPTTASRVESTPHGSKQLRVCEYKSELEDGVCVEKQQECKIVDQRYAGCFAFNTGIVMEDGSVRAIQDISAGDKVLNPKTGEGVAVQKIVGGEERKPLLEISVEEETLRVTVDHAMMVREPGFVGVEPVALSSGPQSTATLVKSAKTLKVGDYLLTRDGTFTEILALRETAESGEFVLNLQLEGGGGLLVTAGGVVTGDLVLQKKLTQE